MTDVHYGRIGPARTRGTVGTVTTACGDVGMVDGRIERCTCEPCREAIGSSLIETCEAMTAGNSTEELRRIVANATGWEKADWRAAIAACELQRRANAEGGA